MGTGDNNFRPTPVRLGFANDWTHSGGGDRYAIYLKTNGDAYTAGWSPQGQMGLGPNALHNTMVQIACPESPLAADDFRAENEMKVYPNPVTDVLNISFDSAVDSVAIYNLMGQEVYVQLPNSKDFKLNIAHLSAGAYMVKCTSGSQTSTFKIIKQ